MTPSAARRLARFVVALEPNDVPGCSLAAARYDFGRAARATAERLGGKPESTVVGSAIRAAAANAVLANATLAHGLDFDDTREDAIVHTGCVAVPTSLAVGEATGASGRAALTAIVAAVEVMCRVGLAVPGKFHARHCHPTALAGAFAAAARRGSSTVSPRTSWCAPSGSAGARPRGSSSISPTAPGPSASIRAGRPTAV